MPNSGENKSRVGLKDLYIAEVLQDDESAFVTGTPERFAPAAEANFEPTVSSETQYADDAPHDVMNAEGETKVTGKVTSIPFPTLAKATGKTFDAASGRVYDSPGATPPYYALGCRSLKSNGKYRYYWFLKGQFSMPKEEFTTRGEKPEPKLQEFTYTAIQTIHPFDLGGGVTKALKRVMGDEDTTNFDATGWFLQVQTPATTAPSALALSSSDPADGASGVLVTKAPTLTFNNALIDGSEANIVLTKSDGTIKAATYAIDTARKIITITPTTNLAAATDYVITIAVTDVFGQTLRAVLNFTTA